MLHQQNKTDIIGPHTIKQGTLTLSNNYTLTYTGANLTIGTKAISTGSGLIICRIPRYLTRLV